MAEEYVIYFHPKKSDGLAFLYKKKKFDIYTIDCCFFQNSSTEIYQQVILNLKGTYAKKIVVGNCHLIGDPNLQYKQKEQAEEMAITLKEKSRYHNASAIIICGDMNAIPTSDTYKIMENRGYKSCQKIVNHREPDFTFWTDKIKKTCDYIWIQSNQLQPTTSKGKFNIFESLPSKDIPSDHIPLVITFAWNC